MKVKIKSFFKKYFWLILIVAIGATLRLYKLSSIPLSLNWDETAIGWNAKTLFHTRRDEYGTLLPLSFKSFSDHKAPFLVYLTAPFVGLLGLKEWVVRLPSVLAGLITIIVAYFLSLEIGVSQNLKQKSRKMLATVSSTFIALSTWHTYFSRPAFESNVALMWLTLGVWLFLLSLKIFNLIFLSGLSFILSIYTYHSPKIILPIFLPIIFLLYKKELLKPIKKNLKFYLTSSAILLITVIPILKVNLNQEASSRAKSTIILYDDNANPKPLNRELLGKFISNYSLHLTPKSFIKGNSDNYRLSMKNNGLMPVVQYLLFLIGLIFLLKNHKNKTSILLISWFLLSFLPSALGKDIVPNNIRSLNSLVPILLISALGFVKIWELIKPKKARNIVILVIIIFYFCGIIKALKEYFIDFPNYSAQDWQYGYKQAVQVVKSHEHEVDSIIITTHYGQPHIFTYFFQNRKPLDVFWGSMISYQFKKIDWSTLINQQNQLIIATPEEISPKDPKVIDIINFPDNTTAFVVVKT